MNSWIRTDRQIGKWSAITLVALAVTYITTGTIWLVSNIDSAKVLRLQPSEPYLTIMETLMLLMDPALVALFAAIHTCAPPERKAWGLAAFGSVILLVAITGVVHFVQLVVVRRAASETVAEVFTFYTRDGRPSAMFAAEMLAWDFFFGFAMLFAAPIFRGGRLQNTVRLSLMVSGMLCLAGFSGPVSGDMRFQIPAILGYAFGFTVVCLLLAILFSRSDESSLER